MADLSADPTAVEPEEDRVQPVSAQRLEPLSARVVAAPAGIAVRLTTGELEALAWAGIGLVALLLRLVGLGARPLADHEAIVAFQSYQLYLHRAEGDLLAGPLFQHLQLLLFALFTANDAAARMVPALAGVALALAPALLRPQLGPASALFGGLALATEPLLVYAGRDASATTLLLLLLLLIVAAVVRRASQGERWAPALGALLALALAADPAAVPALATLGLAAVLVWPQESLAALRSLWRQPRRWGTAVVAFAATAAAVDTALFGNLGGLQYGLVTPWTRWTEGLHFWPLSRGPLLQIAAFDLPLLALGLVGAGLGALRRQPLTSLLGIWALLALALSMLSPGGDLRYLTQPLLPLTLLAGDVLARLVMPRWRMALDARVLLAAAVVALVLVFLFLALSSALYRNQSLVGQPLLAASAALVLAVLLAVVLVGRAGTEAVLMLVMLGVAAIYTTTSMAALNYDLEDPSALYLLHGEASDPAFPAVAERAQLWARMSPTTQIVVDERLRSQLAWYLRDLPVRFTTTPPPLGTRLIWAWGPEGPPPVPAATYDRLAWKQVIVANPPSPEGVWRWIVFREVAGQFDRYDIIASR